jgi:hypothetical protein
VAANGTTLESAIFDGPDSGSVTICAIGSNVVAPALSHWGFAALVIVLLLSGVRLRARRA